MSVRSSIFNRINAAAMALLMAITAFSSTVFPDPLSSFPGSDTVASYEFRKGPDETKKGHNSVPIEQEEDSERVVQKDSEDEDFSKGFTLYFSRNNGGYKGFNPVHCIKERLSAPLQLKTIPLFILFHSWKNDLIG